MESYRATIRAGKNIVVASNLKTVRDKIVTIERYGVLTNTHIKFNDG